MFFCFLCWFVLGLGICPSWELSHTGPPGWLPHLRIGSRMCPSQSLLRSLTRINTSQCSGRHRWQAVNFAQRPENISKAPHYCWPHCCCHCPLQNGAWLTNVIKKNPCQIHVKLERRSSLLSDGSPDLLLAEAMIEGLPYRLFFPAKGMRLNFSLTAIRISAFFFSARSSVSFSWRYSLLLLCFLWKGADSYTPVPTWRKSQFPHHNRSS